MTDEKKLTIVYLSELRKLIEQDRDRDERKPDQPVKENDHALDALRYLIMFLDGDKPLARKRQALRPLPNAGMPGPIAKMLNDAIKW